MSKPVVHHAIEGMLVALEGDFTMAGYRLLMNQDRARRDELIATLVAHVKL